MAKNKKSLEELEAELAALESELSGLESGDMPAAAPKKAKGKAKAAAKTPAPEPADEPVAEPPSKDAGKSRPRLRGLLSRSRAEDKEGSEVSDDPAPEPDAAEEGTSRPSRFGLKLPFKSSSRTPARDDAAGGDDDHPPDDGTSAPAADNAPSPGSTDSLPAPEDSPHEAAVPEEPPRPRFGLKGLRFGKSSRGDAEGQQEAHAEDVEDDTPAKPRKFGLAAFAGRFPSRKKDDAADDPVGGDPASDDAPPASAEGEDWGEPEPAPDTAGPGLSVWDVPDDGASFEDAPADVTVEESPGEVAAPDAPADPEPVPKPAIEVAAEPEHESVPEPDPVPEPEPEPAPAVMTQHPDWKTEGRRWRRRVGPGGDIVHQRLDLAGNVVEEEVEPREPVAGSGSEATPPVVSPVDDVVPSDFGYRSHPGTFDADPDPEAAASFGSSGMIGASPGGDWEEVEEVPPEDGDRRGRFIAWLFPGIIVLIAILVVIAMLPTLMGGDDEGGGSVFGVNVNPPGVPVVTFTSGGKTLADGALLDPGTTVGFSVPAVGGVTYTWDFGDGSPPEKGASVSHRFTKPGTFTITTTASNAGGDTTKTVTVVIATPLTAKALILVGGAPLGNGAFVFPGDTLTFSSNGTVGDGPMTFAWTLGTEMQMTGASITHAFAASGPQAISLKVTDAHGRSKTVTLGTVMISYRASLQDSLDASASGAQSRTHDFPVAAGAARVRVNVTYAPAGNGGLLGGAGGEQLGLSVADAGGTETGTAQGTNTGAEVVVTDLSGTAPGTWQSSVSRPQGLNSAAKSYTILFEVAYPARTP